jgi:hypothetical protein
MEPADIADADGRPIPFALRVSTDRISSADDDDEFALWLGRSRLTGALVVTAGGSDLEFSDLGTTL